jgi:hypothetical protein
VIKKCTELAKSGSCGDTDCDPRLMHILVWLHIIGKQVLNEVEMVLALESLLKNESM